MIEPVHSPVMSGSLSFKVRVNNRISSFHDHVTHNKRIKPIHKEAPYTMDNSDRAFSSTPSTSSSRPIDLFKNLYSGRSTLSHDDVSSQKHVKFIHNNGG
ncbi:hypothetical protein RclHR1_08840002 [Rhizophagus clarus]|nr:hypothetical protein RclHR1_08840002 [Rhizophagus clarus]